MPHLGFLDNMARRLYVMLRRFSPRQSGIVMPLHFIFATFLLPLVVVNAAAQSGRTIVTEQNQGIEQPIYYVVYSVADLPVWRVDAEGNSHFDPSVVIAHIRSNVDPESWENGAVLKALEDNKGLLVGQTKENLRRISQLLRRLNAYTQRDVAETLAANLSRAKTSNQNVLLFIGDANARTTGQFFDLQFVESTSADFGSYIVQCASPSDARSLDDMGIHSTEPAPRLIIFTSDGDIHRPV